MSTRKRDDLDVDFVDRHFSGLGAEFRDRASDRVGFNDRSRWATRRGNAGYRRQGVPHRCMNAGMKFSRSDFEMQWFESPRPNRPVSLSRYGIRVDAAASQRGLRSRALRDGRCHCPAARQRRNPRHGRDSRCGDGQKKPPGHSAAVIQPWPSWLAFVPCGALTQLLRATPSTRSKTSLRRAGAFRDSESPVASKVAARTVPRFRPALPSRRTPRSVVSLEEAQRSAAAAVYAWPP